jgi:hypothetical protein
MNIGRLNGWFNRMTRGLVLSTTELMQVLDLQSQFQLSSAISGDLLSHEAH